MSNQTILSRLLFRIYAVKKPFLRNFVLRMITKLEGGQMCSLTLRKVFAHYHNIEIGLYSYGGCFESGRITAFTKIGRYCSFAEGVCIFNRNHPVNFKSMHPFFFNTAFGYVQKEVVPFRELIIGNDVWIGRNALILPSVKKIGNGAVIGAGAVVSKDVPSYAIVAGNPAKLIRYRFSESTIRKIEDSCWWEKDIEELKGNLEEFLSSAEPELGTAH
jgi:virginiamycin A acetyltransferase